MLVKITSVFAKMLLGMNPTCLRSEFEIAITAVKHCYELHLKEAGKRYPGKTIIMMSAYGWEDIITSRK